MNTAKRNSDFIREQYERLTKEIEGFQGQNPVWNFDFFCIAVMNDAIDEEDPDILVTAWIGRQKGRHWIGSSLEDDQSGVGCNPVRCIPNEAEINEMADLMARLMRGHNVVAHLVEGLPMGLLIYRFEIGDLNRA